MSYPKKTILVSEPTLNGLEEIYVRSYLSTLSHGKAYQITTDSNNSNNNNNKYSKQENIKYHIRKSLQSKYEALSLDPDKILTLLYEEATFKGENSSHGSRITAITLLGKHLGMFVDKKEEKNITYNLINYEGTSNPVEPSKEVKEELTLEEPVKSVETPNILQFETRENNGNN